ncbi:Cytochrome P450 71D10 [Hibiscus syriacus]|uniref:Cytochrome P450 71D10 n=1 Tax=Hibiscus syriacus TaxID=106335 RepID=A0A6A3CCJ9_HIBSY|nr:Cytochrome P450 71D10 [Hibiscus syriacus]
MELQFPCVPLLFTIGFLFITVRILKISAKANRKNLNKLPPGPWKLPLIGNLLQLMTSSPHHTLRDLSNKYGPLMHLQLGEVPTIVVSSAKIAEEVLKTNDIVFSHRPRVLACEVMSYNRKGIIFTPHGKYWKQMRKICTMELLSPSRVHSFRSIRTQEVTDFVKSIASNQGSAVNLSDKIFSLSYGITERAAFGKKSKGQEEFMRIIKEIAKLSGAFCLADMYPSSEVLKLISGTRIKVDKLHRDSDKILENIVNEHKEKINKGDHHEAYLVDVLLQLQQRGDLEFPLGNESIKAVMKDMFGAGSETSATTIEWAMSELLRNPTLLKQAQNEVRSVLGENATSLNEDKIHELKFLRLIVKETLRLHPPALLIIRQCAENCVINGYDVAAKTKVLINAWAMQRDPCYWNDADQFRPQRFYENSMDFRGTNFEYIPFGAGRRICPGILFAMPSIELPLASLLYHFDWKLPNQMRFEDLDMTESFGITARRKNDSLLIPIPYLSVN